MDPMAIHLAYDKLDNIKQMVMNSHLVYLQTDESPQKLDEKRKLQGYIKEYLSLVPHKNKYNFKETAHILQRSASTLVDFSGYRASSAWSAISLYASNLLSQPWRKEYKTLRTYSGYYKHEIESNLVGAELMFELMGYKHTGLGIMTLEEPIDPDKVSNVSRDAIVAFVECQIMIQIWESMSKMSQINWLDVLKFREQYVGTPEQAIRALDFQLWERFNPNRNKQLDNYRDFNYPVPVVNAMMPALHPYQILTDNYPYDHLYESNFINPHQRFAHQNYLENNRYESAYKLPQDYVMNNPPIYNKIPIERLVEVDPLSLTVSNYDRTRLHRHSNKHLDQTDFSRHLEDNYGKIERKNTIKTSTSLDSASENWDYVYNKLDSVGYSKDVSNQEDILRKNRVLSSKEKKVDRKSADLVDFNLQAGGGQLNSREIVGDVAQTVSHKCKDTKWSCSTCTYLNSGDVKICEMCNKSRQKGNEDRPLASGGKECPQCTLVNEKDALKCEACGNDLLNSPTYI